MKKKAAICISGHMRDYERRNESFYENYIKCNPDYDFDIFISTWNVRNTITSHSFTRRKYDKFDILDEKKITEYYNPKILIFEENDDEKFVSKDQIRGGNISRAVYSQLYKVNQIGNAFLDYIQEQNLNYDCIIKTRPDAVFQQPVLLDKLDMDVINLEFDDMPNWISDKVMIMNLENYKTYINIFPELDRLCGKIGGNTTEILIFVWFLENELNFIKNPDLNIHAWD